MTQSGKQETLQGLIVRVPVRIGKAFVPGSQLKEEAAAAALVGLSVEGG